jgi:hypothetical protein
MASVTGQEISSDLIIAALFGLVEVRPHAGRAGEVDAHPAGPEPRERALQLVGGADHLVLVARRAGLDHGRMAIGRDRHARRGATTFATAGSLSACPSPLGARARTRVGHGLVGAWTTTVKP